MALTLLQQGQDGGVPGEPKDKASKLGPDNAGTTPTGRCRDALVLFIPAFP